MSTGQPAGRIRRGVVLGLAGLAAAGLAVAAPASAGAAPAVVGGESNVVQYVVINNLDTGLMYVESLQPIDWVVTPDWISNGKVGDFAFNATEQNRGFSANWMETINMDNELHWYVNPDQAECIGVFECTAYVVSPSKVVFRMGPLADGGLAVTPPAKARVGQPTRLTATVKDSGPALPATVSFDLGPDGSGECSDIPVTKGTATCDATFDKLGTQPVKVSYSGNYQYATKSVDTAVDVNSRTVFQIGWNNPRSSPLDVGDIATINPQQIAVSHDGVFQSVIGKDGVVYLRKNSPERKPAVNFRAVLDNTGKPMHAKRVVLDDDGAQNVQLMVIGTDDKLYHKVIDTEDRPWTPVDTDFEVSDVSIAIDTAGRTHVGVITEDGQARYKARNGNGVWNPTWETIKAGDGNLTGRHIAVATDWAAGADQPLDLFVVGADGTVSRTRRLINQPFDEPQNLPMPAGIRANGISAAVGVDQHWGSVLSVAMTTTDGEVVQWVRLQGAAWGRQAPNIATDAGNLAVSGGFGNSGVGITVID